MTIEIEEKLPDGTRLFGWKSEPSFTPIAPSYTHWFSEKKIFSSEECESWNKYLLRLEPVLLDKFITTKGDGGTGLGESSITSRYAHFNVLKFDFDLVPKLKESICDGICTLLRVSDNTDWQDTLYSNSWFNVLRQGEEMDVHAHFDTSVIKHILYGFHVTIKAIAPSFTDYYHHLKFSPEIFHIPNKIGYLTLFPNFIPHGVSPNRYTTPRVTIAGDTFSSSWLDETTPGAMNKNLVKLGIIKHE